MKISGIAVLASCLLASLSLAFVQPSVSEDPPATTPRVPRPKPQPPTNPPANPCNASPPSVSTCWDCFQDLLRDCDVNNPAGERREACYRGANNFFSFCLTRVPAAPGTPPPPNGNLQSPRAADKIDGFNTLSGVSFSMLVNNLAFDDVDVYLRDLDDEGKPRQRQVDSFTTPFGDHELFVTIEGDFDVEPEGTGIVVVFRNGDVVVGAYAEAVSTVNGLDLNQDALVDNLDLLEAMNRLASEKMSADDFDMFLAGFNSR